MARGGYTSYYQVLNAKDYGIPQNRERVFTISIRNDLNQTYHFPEKQELKLKLKDMLEDEVDESFYLTEKQIEQISYWKSYRQPINEALERERESTPTITAKSNTSLNASMILLKENTICNGIKKDILKVNVEPDMENM